METKVYTVGQGSVERIDDYVAGRNKTAGLYTALMLGGTFNGEYQNEPLSPDTRNYWIPHKTIVGLDRAKQLGIAKPEDLYGGVVPYGYIATKIIAHPVVDSQAARPPGWSDEFTQTVRDVVLPGFSVFSREDAMTAFKQLIKQGPVRTKRTLEAGGLGQEVIQTEEDLLRVLSDITDIELSQFGLAMETNLYDTHTGSIGSVIVDGIQVSYYGEQRTYPNVKKGEESYAGSDLTFVRGPMSNLLDLPIQDKNLRRAIVQATRFDHAVGLFDEAIISRRNYDTIVGRAFNGETMSGVLEQSWRIGGASGPEILAALALRSNPSAMMATASSYHEFRDQCNGPLPDDAYVFFDGMDRIEGRVRIYTRLHEVS